MRLLDRVIYRIATNGWQGLWPFSTRRDADRLIYR